MYLRYAPLVNILFHKHSTCFQANPSIRQRSGFPLVTDFQARQLTQSGVPPRAQFYPQYQQAAQLFLAVSTGFEVSDLSTLSTERSRLPSADADLFTKSPSARDAGG